MLLRAAGDTESPRGGSRRARPDLAVTHGHADAGHGPGEVRLPPLWSPMHAVWPFRKKWRFSEILCMVTVMSEGTGASR